MDIDSPVQVTGMSFTGPDRFVTLTDAAGQSATLKTALQLRLGARYAIFLTETPND